MSNRFHNKFHKHNHHSLSSVDVRYPDAGYDPIASFLSPFQGEFYSEGNIITTESLSAQKGLSAFNGNFSDEVFIGSLPTSISTDTIVHESGILKTNPNLTTFANDLTADLCPGYTFGKYENADIIPAAGKTVQDVISMALSCSPVTTVPITVGAFFAPGSITITYSASTPIPVDTLLFINFVQYIPTTTVILSAFVSIQIFPNFNFGTTTVTFPNDYNTLIPGSCTNSTPTVSIFNGKSKFRFNVGVVTSVFASPPTPTPTQTPTGTVTPTPTITGTVTPTPTIAGTVPPTPTNTGTQTPTPTNTGTETPTPTNTGTQTPTPTQTLTPTPTNTGTETPTPTNTGTQTPTPTQTLTPTPTEYLVDEDDTTTNVVAASGFASRFDDLTGCLPFGQLPSLIDKLVVGAKGEDICRVLTKEPTTITIANSGYVTDLEHLNFGGYVGKVLGENLTNLVNLSGFTADIIGLNNFNNYNSAVLSEQVTQSVNLYGFTCNIISLPNFNQPSDVNIELISNTVNLSGWSGGLFDMVNFWDSSTSPASASETYSAVFNISGFNATIGDLGLFNHLSPNPDDLTTTMLRISGFNSDFVGLTSFDFDLFAQQLTETSTVVSNLTGFATTLEKLSSYNHIVGAINNNSNELMTSVISLTGFSTKAKSLTSFDHLYPIIINNTSATLATSVYEVSALKSIVNITTTVALTSHYIQWQTYDSTTSAWSNLGGLTNDPIILLTASNTFNVPAIRFIEYINTTDSSLNLELTSAHLTRPVIPILPISVATTDIELWLDSSIGTFSGTSLATMPGQLVTKWCDLSRNERHAVDSSSGNPSIKLNAINAKTALQFVGGQELVGNFSNLNAYSIFIVAKRTGSAVNPSYTLLFDAGIPGSGSNNDRFFQMGCKTNSNFAFTPRLSASSTELLQPVTNDFTIHAAIGRLGVGNSEYSCYNFAQPTGNTQTINTIANSGVVGALKYSIGSSTWGDTQYDYVGEIAEILVLKYDVSSTDRNDIVTYLNNKWTVY